MFVYQQNPVVWSGSTLHSLFLLCRRNVAHEKYIFKKLLHFNTWFHMQIWTMQRIEEKDGMLRRKFMRNHKIYDILGGEERARWISQISGKTPGRVGKKLMLSKLFSPFIFRSLSLFLTRFSLTFLVCQSYTIFWVYKCVCVCLYFLARDNKLLFVVSHCICICCSLFVVLQESQKKSVS